MKKKLLLNIAIGCVFIFVLTSAINNNSGPGGGYSNAPNESSCVSCHGGSVTTTGTALNNLRLKGNFTGNGYIPDSTYTIELTYKQTGISKFGFQITALNSSNDPIGTFTNLNSRTSKVTATISSKTREYIQHTSTGTSTVGTDSTRWTFSWKAPNSVVGKVTFYVVVMSANNNGQNSGDAVYGKTFDINPSTLLPKATASTTTNPLCNNSNIVFNGSGTNSPTSYAWRFINGTPATSTQQNPNVVWTSAGQKLAILNVRNAKGISFPDTLRINLVQSPAASISSGSSARICNGDSILVSAANASNIDYLWLPNNKPTRTVFLKDSGIYNVRFTSTINGCSSLSPTFTLNVAPTPIISIVNKTNRSTFCNFFNDTFTASGSNLDTLFWYVNNQLYEKSINKKIAIFGTQNTVVYAVAKSSASCLSSNSNNLNIAVEKAQYPDNITIQKTTSKILINWKKKVGIIAYSFSLNQSQFNSTTTDSSLEINGLSSATTYNVVLRFNQNNFCQIADSTLIVKTNDCSNLTYTISPQRRVCKGNSLSIVLSGLYKSKYSVSFANGAFLTDTIYTFTPGGSDTLLIKLIDSASLNCQPIIEKIAYRVDVSPNISNSGPQNLALCSNNYIYTVNNLFANYQFLLNGIEVANSSNSSFNYQNLKTGDLLLVNAKLGECSKIYGPLLIKAFDTTDAQFSFVKNWYNYTFTPMETSYLKYKWLINNTDSFLVQPQIIDMRPYNASSVSVSLTTTNATGCINTTLQSITLPNFSAIKNTENDKIVIFPNPFGKSLNLTNESEPFKIEVYDAIGKLVFAKNIETTQENIDTERWSNGVYYIKISVSNQIYQKQFIKIE